MLYLGRGSAHTKEGIKVAGLEITAWVTASPESGMSESCEMYKHCMIRRTVMGGLIQYDALRRRQEELSGDYWNCSESDNQRASKLFKIDSFHGSH